MFRIFEHFRKYYDSLWILRLLIIEFFILTAKYLDILNCQFVHILNA